MAEVKSIIAWALAGEAPAKRLAKDFSSVEGDTANGEGQSKSR